jgi:hypothetical protein
MAVDTFLSAAAYTHAESSPLLMQNSLTQNSLNFADEKAHRELEQGSSGSTHDLELSSNRASSPDAVMMHKHSLTA